MFPKCPEILINSNKLLKLWKSHRKTKTLFYFFLILKCGQQRTYVHIKPIQHPINHLKNKKSFPIIKSCWFLKTFHKICSLINQRVTSSDFHCCVGLFFNFYSRVEVEYLSSSNLTKLFFIVGWWIGNMACCPDAGFASYVI